MPAVNGHPDNYLRDTIKALTARVTALENQQNFGVRDKAGIVRVQGGLLPNGDYGFAVTDALGNMVELVPPIVAPEVDAAEACTATAYSDITTPGPLCSVRVGATGRVNVIASAYVAIPGLASANPVAYVGLMVDGVLNPNRALMEIQDATGTSATGIAATVAGQAVIGGLAPGLHTFRLQYRVAGMVSGSSCTFAARTLFVQPL